MLNKTDSAKRPSFVRFFRIIFLRMKFQTDTQPSPTFYGGWGFFYLLIFYYRLCQRTASPTIATAKIVEVIFFVLRWFKKQRCTLAFEHRPETADLTLAIIRIERTFRFDFLQFYLSFAFVSIPLHTSFLCNPKRPYIARSEFTIIHHFRLCVIGRKQKYHFAPPISE